MKVKKRLHFEEYNNARVTQLGKKTEK